MAGAPVGSGSYRQHRQHLAGARAKIGTQLARAPLHGPDLPPPPLGAASQRTVCMRALLQRAACGRNGPGGLPPW
eukprot:scaffold1619_cov242-Prasinococcus_capsulatus_cf.AAC.3